MRTRGERRRLTARAIKRKWSRYLQEQCGITCGQWYCKWDGRWINVHTDQHQPHRYNKKSIDQKPDWWPGRRHRMDWDTPQVTEWDGWDEPYCTLGSTWSNYCRCDRCSYLDYLSRDPFDDLGEYMLWEDPSDLSETEE